MRLLLDTHAILWWLIDDPKLPPAARRLIRSRSNVIYVSAASAWEVSTKFRLGKLPTARDLVHNFEAVVANESFEPLPITVSHAVRAGLLPGPHRDPFDRMLIAQSQAENVPIISRETIFDGYNLNRYWD